MKVQAYEDLLSDCK